MNLIRLTRVHEEMLRRKGLRTQPKMSSHGISFSTEPSLEATVEADSDVGLFFQRWDALVLLLAQMPEEQFKRAWLHVVDLFDFKRTVMELARRRRWQLLCVGGCW